VSESLGVQIRISPDTAGVDPVLRKLASMMTDMTEVMDDIGASLVMSTKLRFEDGRGPSGKPWQISQRAEIENGQTLRDTGRLMDSITHLADRDSVLVGTNVIYGPPHQFGATIKAKTEKGLRFKVPVAAAEGSDDDKPGSAWRRVMQVVLPERPFLGVNAGDEDDIRDIVSSKIQEIAAAGGTGAPA
jgi:phage virion morphogenesis protein